MGTIDYVILEPKEGPFVTKNLPPPKKQNKKTSWAGSATLEIQVSESRVEYIQQEKSIWSDGWVDDSFRKYCHFMAPSCKLELARFSA